MTSIGQVQISFLVPELFRVAQNSVRFGCCEPYVRRKKIMSKKTVLTSILEDPQNQWGVRGGKGGYGPPNLTRRISRCLKIRSTFWVIWDKIFRFGPQKSMFRTKPAAGEKILRIYSSNSSILLRKSIKFDLQIPKLSRYLIWDSRYLIWWDPQNQWG